MFVDQVTWLYTHGLVHNPRTVTMSPASGQLQQLDESLYWTQISVGCAKVLKTWLT